MLTIPRLRVLGQRLYIAAAGAIALSLFAARTLSAQERADGTPRRCDAIVVPVERARVQQFVSLALPDSSGDRGRSLDGMERQNAQQLLERIVASLIFEPPQPFRLTTLGLSTPFASIRDRNPLMVPDVAAHISAFLHRDGRLSHVQLGRASVTPTADSTFWRSLKDPVAPFRLADLAPRLTADSIAIRLETTVKADFDEHRVTVPLHELELPTFVGQAVRLAGTYRAPVYPTSHGMAGREGSVLASFVVDVGGKVDAATIQILRSTHTDFSESVRVAVRALRFAPASIGECGVRQLVQQSFEFSRNRRR